MTAERAAMLVKKVTYLLFVSPSRDKSCFCRKTRWQLFLLVFGRHVGAHLDGPQYGVSIAVTWILVRVFACLPFFFPSLWTLSNEQFWNWPFLKTTVTKREILTLSIFSLKGVWKILHSSPGWSFVRILQVAYFLVERSCLFNKISSLITVSKSPRIPSSSFNI